MSDAARNWMADMDIFVDPDGSETSQAASIAVISRLLLEKKITIQDVVSAIGKYLTTTDNSIRARGILLLGELLVKLASVPLEDSTIASLSTFFTGKFEDWSCLRGALIGSVALLRRSSRVGAVEGPDVKKMATTVLQHLHVQALGVTDRLLSLELFECLMKNHGVSVSSMGGDFVEGVSAAIDTEKDPRCLLVAFRLVEHLVQLFPAPDGPLAENAEDVFDVVSRYFPVTFTPAPNDTRGVSRDDLAGALLKVFTSTTLFAPFCIPLLLEKLSSKLPRAKKDSLRYLGSCALSFGPQTISGHVGAIWIALKGELIPSSFPASASSAPDEREVEIRGEALNCLTRCVEAFQKGGEEQDIQVTGDLLKLICEDDCIEDLLRYVENDLHRESECKKGFDSSYSESMTVSGPGSNISSSRANEQTRATGRILTAVVKASPSSCYNLTDKVLNRLLSASGIPSLGGNEILSHDNTSIKDTCQLLQRDSLSLLGLEVTVQILEGASKVAETTAILSTSSTPGTKLITKKWLEPVCSVAPRLLMTFNHVTLGQALTQDHSKLGVAGLQALASFPAAFSPLSESQLQFALSILVETLLDDTRASDLRDNALGAILSVSNSEEKFRPLSDSIDSLVLDAVTPKLLEAVEQAQTTATVKPALQALAAISGPRQIARERVLSDFRQIIGTQFPKLLLEATDNIALQKMVLILECLSQEIIPFCEKGSADQMMACHIILDIWSAIQSLSHTAQQVSEEVLSSIMAVNRVVVRRCPEESQEQILLKATSVLLECYSSTTLANDTSTKQEGMPDLTSYHRTNSTEEKGWLVALVASVVIGLLPGVVSSRHDLLLKTFVRNSILKGSSLRASVAAQATASLLNKWKDALNRNGGREWEVDTLDEAIREAMDNTLMPVINQCLRATASDTEESNDGLDKEEVARAVFALAWVGKGLAMRGHSRVPDIAGVLLALLQSEGIKLARMDAGGEQPDSPNLESVVAHAAAESIGIIVKDDVTCLDRAHNAVVRPLFKQRFFTSMLPPLQQAVRFAGNLSYRIWFFRAFGHLLSGTPHAAVLTEGQKVFPLVLEGLSTLCSHPEDSNLLLAAILTLSSFLTDENYGRNIAADYVPAMVKRLITLLQYRSSYVIRETALQCLAAIVGLPFNLLFPVKPQVMKAVTAALDDHKRIVRKEAVRCRQVWSSISTES